MKSKKTKKILLIFAIIIIFVVGIFIGNLVEKNKTIKTQSTNQATTQVVEKTVGTQTIENTLTGSGEIAASDTEKLTLSTSKYFKVMCAEKDDIVKEGENILEYSNGTYLTAEYDCLISSYSVPETGSKCTTDNYIEVQNLATMTMNFSIDESEINKVAKGQEVTIKLSAIDNKTYTGLIKSVSGVGTYQSSGTTFSAVIEFENDGNAKPGMSASCSIVIEKAEKCIAVPIKAVQTSNEQKYVVVVDGNGSTSNINIETGISNDSYVQVTSGLSGGETIQMVETVSTSSSTRGNRGTTSGSNGSSLGGAGQMPTGGEMPDMSQMPKLGN